MGRLHEVLAVETDRANVAEKILAEAAVTFTKKTNLFHGQTRSLSMFDENRKAEDHVETSEVSTTVGDKIEYVAEALKPWLDVTFEKDSANQRAVADLVVDGVALVKNAPATFLLGLETKLKKIRMIYETIPTLAPGVQWNASPDDGEGIYISGGSTSFKTEKTFRHKVLVEPTDRHPAQIEKWNEDVPVGRYLTIHKSGAVTPAQKSAMLERIDALIRATKEARQRANMVEVEQAHVGAVLLSYVNSGDHF